MKPVLLTWSGRPPGLAVVSDHQSHALLVVRFVQGLGPLRSTVSIGPVARYFAQTSRLCVYNAPRVKGILSRRRAGLLRTLRARDDLCRIGVDWPAGTTASLFLPNDSVAAGRR